MKVESRFLIHNNRYSPKNSLPEVKFVTIGNRGHAMMISANILFEKR